MRPWCFAILAVVVPMTAQAEDLFIKASRVYTLDGPPLAPGVVHVRDGKIVAVAGELAIPPGSRFRDLGSGVLLPGFIDAASSAGLDGGRTESTVEVSPRIRACDAVDPSHSSLRRLCQQGVTTVHILPGTDNVISGLSCILKTSGDRKNRVLREDHGLAITTSSDPTEGNSSRNRPDSPYNRQPTNRMGVVWILRSEFGLATRTSTPDRAVLREVLSGARPVFCTSRLDTDLLAALRLREEFPMRLVLVGGQEAYRVRQQIAAAKVPVLLAPLSTSAGIGPESTETILNLPGVLHEAGIPFCLTGGDLLDQARFAVRFGLPKDAALEAITVQPARVLQLEQRVGRIQAGRDADLVALSGDPWDGTSRVLWTMIDGVIRAEEP
ncbi:MAG: amidohydrolase family protein [Gemmatales bacterium]|nr:amidohydrolase family protein [Gemmatales bacterium]MDW8387766.1 amidohydrolase family protein [Gemmatales bacterium]